MISKSLNLGYYRVSWVVEILKKIVVFYFLWQVIAKVEAELSCLNLQLQSAPPDVVTQARGKLIKRTLSWAAARDDKHIPRAKVDDYAKNVLQLLLEQEIQFQPREKT